MGENAGFGGEWIFAFLIIAVIFGWGGAGFGGNANTAAYATMADVNSAINAQTNALNQQSILLSSANNNYETARLISDQNMTMMQQNNTNLVNAIQGFNQVNQNIANGFSSINQNISNLGYKMEECCCGIKTMLLENRLQDTQIALQNAQNVAVNAEQSQYLLSQMGQWTPYTAGA
jgi:hypothetical protein